MNIELRREVNKQNMIEEDIKKIDEALKSNDVKFVREVHKYIDGTYQACIKMWGYGMIEYNMDFGFDYTYLDINDLKDNLFQMRPKLKAFALGLNEITNSDPSNSDVNVVVNNSNTNNINIKISFEEAFQKIEYMDGLTQGETEIIQEKIKELENISNEIISKKKKWEKIKPIIQFAIDKGVDVALVFLQLVIQMKLTVPQ